MILAGIESVCMFIGGTVGQLLLQNISSLRSKRSRPSFLFFAQYIIWAESLATRAKTSREYFFPIELLMQLLFKMF